MKRTSRIKVASISMKDLRTLLFLCLVINADVVRCGCRNTAIKLFDDQIQALQKSVRDIVNDEVPIKTNVPVGFHAYMGSHKTYAVNSVWIYDKVVTNTHNAYNATTGKFTVPKKGLYIFTYDTLTNPQQEAHARLFVNGEVKSWQGCNNSGSSGTWNTCSNTAILLLKKGDVVYIADNVRPATMLGVFTSFNGAKLN